MCAKAEAMKTCRHRERERESARKRQARREERRRGGVCEPLHSLTILRGDPVGASIHRHEDLIPRSIDAEVADEQPELRARHVVVVVFALRLGCVLGVAERTDVAAVVPVEEALALLAPHIAKHLQDAAARLGEADVAVGVAVEAVPQRRAPLAVPLVVRVAAVERRAELSERSWGV